MKKYESTINQIGETIEEIENGYGDVLLEYAHLKDLRNFIDEAIKQIESQALDEANRQDGKTFKANGYAFTVNAGRVMYNFKVVPQWAKKKEELEMIEELAKQAAKISAFSTPGKFIVDEYGQVVTPAETTYTKSSLTVKPLKP